MPYDDFAHLTREYLIWACEKNVAAPKMLSPQMDGWKTGYEPIDPN